MNSHLPSTGFSPLEDDVDLEIVDAVASSSETHALTSTAVESIPFLAPRSANKALSRKTKRLFFQDAHATLAPPLKSQKRIEGKANAVDNCSTDALDTALLPSSAIDGDHPLDLDIAGEVDELCRPSIDVTSTFQAEGDKTYLQSGLEDLFRENATSVTNDDGNTLPFCSYLLRRYLNIDNGTFRPHQQEVCLSILRGVNTLAVCPTGWGKSLCYQFPMLVHRLLHVARYKAWVTAQEEAHDAGSGTKVDVALPPQLHSKFCIVVSPLLSLIADQMEKIRSNGCLTAITISSHVPADREAALLRSLSSPNSEVDIVFTSPEKFLGSVALRTLVREQHHRLAMVCVDEVHCVSRWAFDFRPSFMYVSRVVSDALPQLQRSSLPPFLCLTATATSAIIGDIQRDFRIGKTVTAADSYRANLHLASVNLVAQQPVNRAGHAGSNASSLPSSHLIQAPSQRAIQDALVNAVRDMPKPLIVYVHSRADADELSSYLAAKVGHGARAPHRGASGSGKGSTAASNIFSSASAAAHDRSRPSPSSPPQDTKDGRPLVVRCYHAALSRHLRTTTQQQFTRDQIDVLVATVAFGMGIDKPNIRSVIHAYAPSSLESYVQEIGRSGRDGQPSYCRILYNPYDFYALRCRALTSLVSPQEVRAIVQCVFRNPVTTHGDRLMLVCPYKIAEELFVSEETVETVLFMILTGAYESADPLQPVFQRIRGSCPIGYKIVEVHGKGDDENQPREGASVPTRHGGTGGVRQRAKKRGVSSLSHAYGDEVFATTGVGSLLAQLNARDPVLEIFTGRRLLENQIIAVNEANLSWDEFQYRLEDLVASGALKLSRLSASPAYLLELGRGFIDAACPTGQERLASAVFASYNTRIANQTEALKTMFRVLEAPTHVGIQQALDQQGGEEPFRETWTPPSRSLTKVEAVSIANDFVVKNVIRIRSTYEAARCLLGVMPKSLIKHGKYAGQIPLALSWYVSSPYFGTLREFDVDWVLAVLKPHNLDAPERDV